MVEEVASIGVEEAGGHLDRVIHFTFGEEGGQGDQVVATAGEGGGCVAMGGPARPGGRRSPRPSRSWTRRSRPLRLRDDLVIFTYVRAVGDVLLVQPDQCDQLVCLSSVDGVSSWSPPVTNLAIRVTNWVDLDKVASSSMSTSTSGVERDTRRPPSRPVESCFTDCSCRPAGGGLASVPRTTSKKGSPPETNAHSLSVHTVRCRGCFRFGLAPGPGKLLA